MSLRPKIPTKTRLFINPTSHTLEITALGLSNASGGRVEESSVRDAIFTSTDKYGCQQWRILDSDEEDKIPAVYTLKVVKVGSAA